MLRIIIGILFFFLFSSSALAKSCGIKLGGGGKDSSWISLKNNQVTRVNDVGGPWSFIRQTRGQCDFTLFNKHRFQGRRANYGTDIGSRLRVGAKGGIDKNGWKVRSLIITPRDPKCTIQLWEDEPTGLSGASQYRRQTFFGPSEFRNITGWSSIEKVSRNCKFKVFNKAKFTGRSYELTTLAHTKHLNWRIRSLKIERVRPVFKDIKSVRGRCLDVAGGVNRNETNVQIYQCNNSKSQKWNWNEKKQIVNAMGRCLDVSGVDITNNSNVEIYKCNDSLTQKWEMLPRGRIQNLSGFCLDVVNNLNVNKTNVQLFKCKERTDAQKWL